MTQANPEFEELQARVSRIEAELNALKRRHADGTIGGRTAIVATGLAQGRSGRRRAPRAQTKAGDAIDGLVAGAGAVILSDGAVYALTVSIQRGWISPPMRVGRVGHGPGHGILGPAADAAGTPRGSG